MHKFVFTTAIRVFLILFSVTVSAQNQKPYTVIIDAGHGGKDNGAQNAGINEKDITLAISEKIKTLNTDKNIQLIFTRTEDQFKTLDQRVDVTNATDLMISLHISIGDKNISGMEIYYPRDGEYTQKSKQFAYILSKSFTDYDIQINSFKLESANYYVLRSVSCPAVLVELGFLTNEHDVAYLNDEDGQEEVALAILQSIESMVPEK